MTLTVTTPAAAAPADPRPSAPASAGIPSSSGGEETLSTPKGAPPSKAVPASAVVERLKAFPTLGIGDNDAAPQTAPSDTNLAVGPAYIVDIPPGRLAD
ncbi:hypothetical protein ACFXGI_02080 [Streptomyces sp. NPDC059355]|uniref:hypothetical protein n=1 Tax=Streptomyces sp. NPDC059355 TaxID=3346811 RepID=UPI003681C2C0